MMWDTIMAGIVCLAIGGAAYLAYHHPADYRRALFILNSAYVGFVLLSVGFVLGYADAKGFSAALTMPWVSVMGWAGFAWAYLAALMLLDRFGLVSKENRK